jgi:hypothetical protein
MSKKAIKVWEKERGFMFPDPKLDVNKKIDEDELNELVAKYGGIRQLAGVNQEWRTEYLKSKGIALTRENMMNP